MVLTAGATGGALLWYGELKLDRVNVPELAVPGDVDDDGEVDIQEIVEVRNILMVGSDSREDLSREERRRLRLGEFSGVRTDTIILVQLDPRRDSAAMLSFPRDLLVTLCDGSEGRINAAFEVGRKSDIGGPSCLVRTVTQLTDIPIHHYVQVEFQGFVDFVDRLGGVRMYIDEPIVDEDARVNLDAGCQVLDGREALGFVRVRKIDSDFGRIARQQRFIREIIDQVTSARVALDIPRLFRLVEAGAEAVDTDHSLSVAVMRRLAFSLRDISSDRIDARTVPAYNREINGAAYVVADEERAQQLFAAFAAGEAAPTDLGTEGPSDVRIADVPPIAITNGTPRAGAAQRLAAALGEAGYQIASLANFPTKVQSTFVRYPKGRKEEAQLILNTLGTGGSVRQGADAQLEVVIGADLNVGGVVTRIADEKEKRAVKPPEPEPAPDFAGVSDAGHKRC